MKCDICDKQLEPGLERFEYDGRVQFKDIRGTIRHAHIGSEAASKMAKQSRSNKEMAAELAEALKVLLVKDDDEKGKALGLIIDKLSIEASRDASGSFKALEASLSLIGQTTKVVRKPRDNETCLTCGRVPPASLSLKYGSAKRVIRLLTKAVANAEAEGLEDHETITAKE